MREAADVARTAPSPHAPAAEHLAPAASSRSAIARVHVARHRRLHALLARDVLDHDHRARCASASRADQRHDGDVDRDAARRRTPSPRPSRTSASAASRSTLLQLVEHPGVGAAKNSCAGLLQDAAPRPRAGCAGPPALQVTILPCSSSVMTPFDIDSEHALVVVLHVLDVGEQLGVLERDRDLRGERLQPRLVFAGERPAALVEHLGHADDPAALVDDRARTGSSA